ncbi:MAG: ATP-dependent RecD-like DNA helicase [Rhodobacteraceae bacterium]|nr:ATP-dependent RecD-like DNA helicase [Paracoccaceae bacterium]
MIEMSGFTEKITGTVARVVYRNLDTGFHILRVNSSQNNDTITVLGVGRNDLAEGHEVSAEGSWENDKKFGRQFRTKAIHVSLPSKVNGIVKFLSSGAFKGIGPIKAQRIVDKFGSKTFEVLDNDPQALLQIKGINQKELDFIQGAWASQKDSASIMTQLHSFGISPGTVGRMYKKLGVNALNILNENPYRLIHEMWGIGFAKADDIALKNGIKKTDTKRIKAGISYVLNKAAEYGSCGLGMRDLEDDTSELLAVDRGLIENSLQEEINEEIVREQSFNGTRVLFPSRLFRFENIIARKIKQLAQQKVPWSDVTPEWAVNHAKQNSEVTLTQEQESAVYTAFSSNVSVITGGPGVGKTTLTNALLKVFESAKLQVKLCAPTGTAAKKMAMATNHVASTIHVTLRYDPISRRMKHDHTDPLECDVVIVDEVSMIDVELMSLLLEAIGPKTAVILIGDVDQLPSIGPGKVLKDIIRSHCVPVVFLKEIFRQAANSQIITASRAIREGFMPNLNSSKQDDFFFIKINDPEKCLETIQKLVLERIPANFGLDPVKEVQVLSPMKNGIIGINNLNVALQKKLNPNPQSSIAHRLRRFALGDKVIQNQNNYDKEVFNGDIGFICEIESDKKSLVVNFSGYEINYEYDALDEIDPAYAITIHKSQGSEYQAVIIPVMMQHRIMLQRKLIYTGLTRGKRLVVMLGQPEALAMAIKNKPLGKNFSRPRITRLEWLLSD